MYSRNTGFDILAVLWMSFLAIALIIAFAIIGV